MPRRRLFVFGIVSIVAVLTVARAEPVNRKFIVSRGADTECTDDAGGTAGSPCRRVNETETAAIETPQIPPEDGKLKDEWESLRDGEDGGEAAVDGEDGGKTAVDEARGKKRRGGYLKVLFAVGAAAKAAMLYAMIHAVALLAGKALVVAKVALALAGAVALKKALEHKDTTSYEIVKHPHHTYSHSHSASVDYDHDHHGGGYDGHHRRRR